MRYLERYRGVPYPELVRHTVGLLHRPPLSEHRVALVIDGTGVGRPIVDLFVEAGLRPIAVTITGGDKLNAVSAVELRVPKRDLIAAAQAALGTKRLKIAEDLPPRPNAHG